MIAWRFGSLRPSRSPYVEAWLAEQAALPPYAKTAPHIRGRVFVQKRGTRPHYAMEVINARTGAVLASDDCSRLDRIVELAHEATAVARGAWFWDYKRKALK